jgi:hypothetical protein
MSQSAPSRTLFPARHTLRKWPGYLRIINAVRCKCRLDGYMHRIFQEMMTVLREAEQRGIPASQATLSLNERGMRRYIAATNELPESMEVLTRLTLVYSPDQEEDVALGPVSN